MDDVLKSRFRAIVGAAHALEAADDVAPYLREWRDRWTGKAALVLRPATTGEVSSIMALAHETGTPVVPQGGNTGLVGGQIPDASGRAIIVNLGRMNAVRAVNPAANSMTVDAGCILQTIQETADAHDRLFPLALAAQGSCQIGGNLSANAGGVGALAYGVARDLVLGLEVVLPDGRVLNDLNDLKKDNTGYALRHLFVGAEGTLGIITGAVLKLFPKPRGRATAWCALDSPQAALALLEIAQGQAGSSLTAFELMADMVYQFTLRHTPGLRAPLAEPTPWHVLLEVISLDDETDATQRLEALLESAFEGGHVVDAVVAQSGQDRANLWAIREGMSESQKPEGASIKHDVSLPVHGLPAFLRDAQTAVETIAPGVRLCTFGHMGDGNLHYNISQPEGADRAAFEHCADAITACVHDLVRAMHGSISAEHGIGQMKRDELAATKDPVALDVMRTLKAALDPTGIMNPGKVL